MYCNVMQCNVLQLQCNAMQCNAMQCNAMQCNAMPMQCYVIAMECSPVGCVRGCVVSVSVFFCVCGDVVCTLSQIAARCRGVPVDSHLQVIICAHFFAHLFCRPSRAVPSWTLSLRVTTSQPFAKSRNLVTQRNDSGTVSLFGSAVSCLTPP